MLDLKIQRQIAQLRLIYHLILLQKRLQYQFLNLVFLIPLMWQQLQKQK